MANQDRMDKIRKVRSLNDIMDVIQSVSKDVAENGRLASRLLASSKSSLHSNVSLSARIAKDETIEIKGGRPTKVTTRTKQAKGDYSDTFNAFKAPPATTLEKHMKVVNALHDNARELDAIEAMLRQTFSGAKAQPAALKGVAALKKEVDAKVREALTSMNAMAEKYFPDEMKTLRDQLTALVLDIIPESAYSDIGSIDYVAVNADGDYELSAYLEIKDLKNSEGYVFEEYCIVLTGVVDAKTHRVNYYLTTMPDFRHPGSYPLGKKVTNAKEMEHTLRLMLAHNDVVSELERRPLPLSTKEAQAKGFKNIRGVGDVMVKDDALYLELVSKAAQSDKGIKQIVNEVIPLLNAASGRKSNTSISWTTTRRGSKKYLKFILVFRPGQAGPAAFNTQKLEHLRSALDLNEKQMHALRLSLKD